jgi:hypothetical protein
VNSLTRALVVVLVSLGSFGVSGCAEDNETEAQKLAKNVGDPGAPAPPKIKAPESNLPPPTTSEEAGERFGGDPRKRMPADYSANRKRKQ